MKSIINIKDDIYKRKEFKKVYVLIYELISGGYWVVKDEDDCLLLLEHIKKNSFNEIWYIHKIDDNTRKYFKNNFLHVIPKDLKISLFNMKRINHKTLCVF